MTDQQENLLTAQIGERDPARQAYPVRVTLGDGSAASDWLSLSAMPPPPPSRSSGADLAAYGVRLFERLFSGPLHGLFRQAWILAQRDRGLLHLQLWIQSGDAELQAVPWELMHVSEGAGPPVPLAATPQVAFSRYVDSATPFGRPIERWPLRILVAIGAPNDLATRWGGIAEVDYEAERARLDRVLGAVSASGQIEYRFLRPATPEALIHAMEDGYQIVIFYGHGLYAPRLGSSLMLERADGAGRLLPAGDLIDALRRNGSRPALFVLISCNTASQRADPALDNLAIQIIRDGSVPAVVAMRDLVAIDLARAFTQYLCDYLLRYGVVDRAVAAARRQVIDPDGAGWSTPVLYMRSRDGRLFVPNAQLEFARLLSNDPQIRQAAVAAPAGPRLALLRARPDDQPGPQAARDLLDQLLALGGRRASPAPIVVSGGSRISRSLLLQQWGWRQNRAGPAALTLARSRQERESDLPSPDGKGAGGEGGTVAVYLPLADDRRLQAGARIEDLLIDAAAEVDPAYGVALMNLLSEGKDGEGARFVLLIDGFEAIGPASRPALAELFDALARRMPAQRVVVSVEEHDAPAALRRADTPWLVLSPLSERQMRAYLSYRDRERYITHMRTIIRNGMRELAGDPQLLTAIAEEMADGDDGGRLTRDDLLSGLLDRVVDRATGPTAPRGIVRECLYALAWALHWSHRRSLPLAEASQVIRAVLQDRSYDAEEIVPGAGRRGGAGGDRRRQRPAEPHGPPGLRGGPGAAAQARYARASGGRDGDGQLPRPAGLVEPGADRGGPARRRPGRPRPDLGDPARRGERPAGHPGGALPGRVHPGPAPEPLADRPAAGQQRQRRWRGPPGRPARQHPDRAGPALRAERRLAGPAGRGPGPAALPQGARRPAPSDRRAGSVDRRQLAVR